MSGDLGRSGLQAFQLGRQRSAFQSEHTRGGGLVASGFVQSLHQNFPLNSTYRLFEIKSCIRKGNRLAGRLFNALHQVMLDIMVVTSQMSDPNHTLQYHRPIFKAIRQHKPSDASRLMTEHLQDARKLLQVATRDSAQS